MRHTLDIEYDCDFQLIGICSTAKDYKLAWEVNLSLDIQLARDPEDFSINLGKHLSHHPIFRYTCRQSHLAYELVTNKGTGGLLIPEQRQVQFFLLLYDNSLLTPNELAQRIKQANSVSLAFEIDIETLSNQENLITA